MVRSMSEEQHVTEQIPAYALGSLDPEETRLIAGHIQDCDQCRAELSEYQEVVDSLPLAVAVAEPPSDLKEKVLRAVESDLARTAPAAEKTPWERLIALLRRPAPAWGLSLILLIVLITSNALLWQRVIGLGSAEADSLPVLTLIGTDNAVGATGRMVIGRDGMVGILVVDGLAPLDETHEYQLWLKQNGERVDGGVFSVSETGYGYLRVRSDYPLRIYSGFGVTVEPAGGSPGPTGEQVLNLDL